LGLSFFLSNFLGAVGWAGDIGYKVGSDVSVLSAVRRSLSVRTIVMIVGNLRAVGPMGMRNENTEENYRFWAKIIIGFALLNVILVIGIIVFLIWWIF